MLNVLYPVIVAAGGIGWLSSSSQCKNMKNLAREVRDRDKLIHALKEELRNLRCKYSELAATLAVEIKDIEEAAESMISLERNKAIEDAISELENLKIIHPTG